MKVGADAALPIVLGALPVIVVLALAGLIVTSGHGVPPQRPAAAQQGSTQTVGNAPSASQSTGPTSYGTAANGGPWGLCLPLIGCI